MPLSRRLALAAFVTFAACSGRSSGTTNGVAAAPVIDSIVPASGPMGAGTPVLVTVFGSGFDDVDNTVVFGDIEVPGRESTHEGTRIRFSIPKVRPLGTEAPPPVLQPGEYDVTVVASGGASAPVRFTLERR